MGFARTGKKAALMACVMQAVMLCPLQVSAEITFQGLEEQPELAKYLQERVVKELEAQNDITHRRAAVRAKFQKALKAWGYYQAHVQNDPGSDVNYLIKPGPIYKISTYDILGYDYDDKLGLPHGNALIAKDVLSAQSTLIRRISEENCFYRLSVKHRIFLDHSTHMADIFFDVEASENATFGQTTFQGGKKIDRDYLHKFLSYQSGDCWKAIELEDTKNALMQTGLINTIDTKLPETLPADGQVPVVMNIKERAPRTVRLGANYNTSEGPGVSAAWVHRNFYGSGEELSVSTKISSVLQNLGLDFTKPFFLSDKQTFKFSSALEREDTDAYEEFSLNATAAITREISDHWSGSLGVGLDLLQVREDGAETENFGLVSFPGTLNFDNRDDVLDPHKGYTLRLLATPVVDAIGTTSPFLKTRLTGTTYFDFNRAVLALRASVGSIFGTETNDIPASYRFYAGGGGSIRGFGYQEAGPVDADNDPAGGRSLLESSAELRFKVTEDIGGVAFVDAGGVYDSAYPDLEGGAFIGAGVGLRYYTDFGPIRFDVGVPLNKKSRLDQNYQIYISIGQAF